MGNKEQIRLWNNLITIIVQSRSQIVTIKVESNFALNN